MDNEMMNPFHEPTLSERLDTYNRRKKEGSKLEKAIQYCKKELAEDYYDLHSAGRHEFARQVLKILEGKAE